MVLSRDQILRSVADGSIGIEPFAADLLKAASYTFTLAAAIARLSESAPELDGRIEPPLIWESIPPTGLLLQPGEFVLGQTNERVNLHGNAVCMISTRARVAQLGMSVTQGSFFAEPDTNRQFILEIHNAGPKPVRLFSGQRIAQGVFIQ